MEDVGGGEQGGNPGGQQVRPGAQQNHHRRRWADVTRRGRDVTKVTLVVIGPGSLDKLKECLNCLSDLEMTLVVVAVSDRGHEAS